MNPRIIVIFLLLVLACLPLALLMPLLRDEGIYSVMIEEQVQRPSLVPTFLSYPSSWKPILFFWVYALPSRLPLPLELTYRLPSILFGLGSAVVSYSILKKLGASDNLAFFSLVIFVLSFLTAYPFSTALTDSMALFLVLSSLRLYMEERLGPWRFGLAASLAFLAFWTKLVIAFLVPILAIVYFYTYGRKVLRDSAFILSLLAVPLAMVAHYLVTNFYGLGAAFYAGNVASHVYLAEPLAQFSAFRDTVSVFFLSGQILWLSLSFFGFLSHWKKNLFMSAWYVMMVVPFLTASSIVWYFLPFMLPLAYYAALALLVWKNEEKADLFFRISFLAVCLMVAVFASGLFYSIFLDYSHYREAGLMLSGKENVLMIGGYSPEVVAYKCLPEMRAGRETDYGWIVFTGNVPDATVQAFISDYHRNETHVADGSFDNAFVTGGTFRKDTNIKKFDYIAIIGYDVYPTDSTLIYNKSNVRIYRAD